MPKSKHQVSERVRSTYAFIKAHRDQQSVQRMCRVLGVAVSGYYLWLGGRETRFRLFGFLPGSADFCQALLFLQVRPAAALPRTARFCRLMPPDILK
jgi:hypothetical protein